MVEENRDSHFDWNQIVTKSVETRDGKELGKVDGLEDLHFVVKDGLIDPTYYRIPREKVEGYDDNAGKVKLSISEEQVKADFQRDNPGYYRENHDPAGIKISGDADNNLGRTSNTIR